MKALWTTGYGRLLSIALAVALIGGGIAGAMHNIPLMCVSLLGGIITTVLAIGVSIERDTTFAVMAAVLLPFIMFLYAVGIGVVMHDAPNAAWAFVGLGAVFAGLGLMGRTQPAAATGEAHA